MTTGDSLSAFELPAALVSPMLRLCRTFNTAVDKMFYDVSSLEAALLSHGEVVSTARDGSPKRPGLIDLSARDDPEGSLLVVDATTASILAHDDVTAFIADPDALAAAGVVTITGVGSSALGSAALAWNVSTALGRPVVAIVPGYGVADMILQGMGGWFGFGLYDALHAKSQVQTTLAAVAPHTARIGRRLSASAPGSRALANGGPVFRTGCGSSDVLHALAEARRIACVVGHSKGALSIANALQGLAPEQTEGLQIVTLGCPVAEDVDGARYHQFLGLFDALGGLNAWGHSPDTWLATDHSTNAALPLSMRARDLVADSLPPMA